jgi:periplasmic copper chaperone A
MNTASERRLLLQAGLVSATGLASSRVQACEFFASTLRVTHPWTRASADDDTSAVVCMRFDEVTRDDRLIGFESDIASGAELAEHGASRAIDLPIPQGRETRLTEIGTHIRLLGLKMPLDVGRIYPIRLRFQHGGDLRAELSVDFTRFR